MTRYVLFRFKDSIGICKYSHTETFCFSFYQQCPCHGIQYGLLPKSHGVLQIEKTDVTECDGGCVYLEWVMRDLIPRHVNASRTAANEDSVKDALQYCKDSLDCFHKFQAHRMRTVNQRLALKQLDDSL